MADAQLRLHSQPRLLCCAGPVLQQSLMGRVPVFGQLPSPRWANEDLAAQGHLISSLVLAMRKGT